MFALAAALAFTAALVLHIAGLGHGHWDVTTFMLAGLLLLALAGATWPPRRP